MFDLREGPCLPKVLVGVNVGLALVDAIIAAVAFSQLIRIHLRNSQLGWTRQKVFHLLIGSSNMGCLIYFPHGITQILFFAAFLLLLSFWVDLCHQADDEDERMTKIVILVTVLVFVIMIACAVIIWIGMGKNPLILQW
ncbi:hypothetical protein M0R45_013564 [Rubus argutus]|uniref:THH1/TOM1/TOM3 domain-containing protein n=1 Tax=Rubus argutus TaxID=59490 RepID=A0AAW1XK53_RUBAR